MLFFIIRALASARGSVARRAQRVAKKCESEGPKGPRTSKASVPVSALASATICFSSFSPKSQFSWLNFRTLKTAKMLEICSECTRLRYEHPAKKLERFIDQVKSYAKLKFCKIEVFVSKYVHEIYPDDPILFLPKSRPCFRNDRFGSMIDRNFFYTAIER